MASSKSLLYISKGYAVMRTKPLYVHVVTYKWNYEGESVEGIYLHKRDAKRHPQGGDETRIKKHRVILPRIIKVPA